MSTEPTQHEAAGPTATGDAWREIDQVVEELAQLSESSADAAEFHSAAGGRIAYPRFTTTARGGRRDTLHGGGETGDRW